MTIEPQLITIFITVFLESKVMSLNRLFCSNNSPKPKYIHPTVIFIVKEVKVWLLFAKYVDLLLLCHCKFYMFGF